MNATRFLAAALLASLAACAQTPPTGTVSAPAGQDASAPAPRFVETAEKSGNYSGQITFLAPDGAVIDTAPILGVIGHAGPGITSSVNSIPYVVESTTALPGGGSSRTLDVRYVETGYKVARVGGASTGNGAEYEVSFSRLAPGSTPQDGAFRSKPVVLTYVKTVSVAFDGVARTERLVPKDGAPADLAPTIRFAAAPMKVFALVQ